MDEDGSDTKTDSTTIKPINDKRIKSDTLKKAPQKIDLSRQDLVRLLSYLEGELQARDVVISTIKSETAKQLLYQAKYGRLGLNDPLAALQRDSETCASTDDFDEAAVGKMYESQLGQLEKLIAVQRRAHHRAKQVLAAAERRHLRTVRELEDERQRRAQDAAQGDDVCMMLEKERERLKQELEVQKCEKDKLEKEIEKLKLTLQEEKDRRKEIVLYLLQERRQLMMRLMEEHLKVQNLTGAPSQGATSSNSKQEDIVNKLKAELEATKILLEKEREESSSLKEIVRTQEDDLNLIRQTILAKTKRMNQQQQQQQLQMQQQQQVNSAGNKPNKLLQTSSGTGNVSSTNYKQQQPTSSSSFGTVRYQILTRPSAPPGTLETAKYAAVESVTTSQNHSPTQSHSPTIRLLNPAFQPQPQLSPQSSKNRVPSSYSSSSSVVEQIAVVPPTVHYSSSMKIPPPPSQFASSGLVNSSSSSSSSNPYSSPASLRRPIPAAGSPVKSSAPGSSSMVNGFAKDPTKQQRPATTGPGSGSAAYSSIYASVLSSSRPSATTPTSDDGPLRLTTNRVALTQLPSNFSFPSSSMAQRSSSTTATSGGAHSTSSSAGNSNESSSSSSKRKTTDQQQPAQVSNNNNNEQQNNNGKKKRTPRHNNNNKITNKNNDNNDGEEEFNTVEPEIAHLAAVIDSLGGGYANQNGGDKDGNNSEEEESELDFPTTTTTITTITTATATNVENTLSSSNRTPSVEQTSQSAVENLTSTRYHNSTPSSQHNSNTWSTTRRFPTTLATSPFFSNRTTATTTSNATTTATVTTMNTPLPMSPVILGKRAPTPSPTNRIPLPLNGVLTKSLSSSSASAVESSSGGRTSTSAIGSRMTKAMSGIAGKVQKKIGTPNVRRAGDHPVRSTQV